MEMKYGGEESKQFVTNLGLITSKGKWGDNIMTAEWTHHISYNPAMVMVNVHDFDATADNITTSKEFGVSLASEKQGGAIKISGNSTGKEIDKIAVLKELGFEFYRAKKIDAYMLKGAVLNLECRLVKHEKVGDHMMFIGEVVEAAAHGEESPILFRSGTGIYKVGEKLTHGKSVNDPETMEQLLQKHRKGY